MSAAITCACGSQRLSLCTATPGVVSLLCKDCDREERAPTMREAIELIATTKDEAKP